MGVEATQAGMHEIRVAGDTSGLAEGLAHQVRLMLGDTVDVDAVHVYHVEGGTPDDIERLAADLFTDPNTQRHDTAPRDDWDNTAKLEVAPKLGVMDSANEFVMKAVRQLGVAEVTAIAAGVEYNFTDPDPAVLQRVVDSGILFNSTVEHIRDRPPETLRIEGTRLPIETIPTSHLDATGLEALSTSRRLFLDSGEMQNIQDHFRDLGREPTDGELQYLAGAWSEHCCHKTFNAKIVDGEGNEIDPLFKQLVDASAPYMDEEVVSAYKDNSGVLLFYDGMCIAIKLETHNSPSAIEPYGGAMTGSGGVFRDIMGTGQGAKNILSIDIFCFAPVDTEQEALPPRTLAPAYLLKRCVDGVRDYGNRMGIPTANGSFHYHPDFAAKPTVMVGALGILPEQYAHKGEPRQGDFVVAIGGRTGLDGVGGATMSSDSMTAETALLDAGAVQKGNAIEEERMEDAILEARDLGLIRAITDCGASGFASAIGEMGEDIGVSIDLARAPLKYEGLAPWQIWVSESQERMVLAIDPADYLEFAAICEKYGVESTALGAFGTEGEARLDVRYDDEQLVDLTYDFIKGGRTQRTMTAEWQAPEVAEREPEVVDWDESLHRLMAHGNIRSHEPVVRQYDHEVQGTSVTKPFGGVHRDAPNDAVVLAPIHGKPYGLVEAHGLNPILNNFDPYRGAKWAVAEALANYAAGGGNPDVAMLADNFVTATPDEHVMGSLVEMVRAYVDCIHAVKRPVITGKDSLSSRYKWADGTNLDVPPVLNVTAVGKIPDIEKTVTTDIKKPGSRVVLVGKMDYQAMAGSAFYDVADGSAATVPDVDLEVLPDTLIGMHGAIQTGKVLACHDVSEGGIAASVAEMCFGGDCGVELAVPEGVKPENFMFNETAGNFLVEVADDADLSTLFGSAPYQVIGNTRAEKTISAHAAKRQLFRASVDSLKAAWKQEMQEFFS